MSDITQQYHKEAGTLVLGKPKSIKSIGSYLYQDIWQEVMQNNYTGYQYVNTLKNFLTLDQLLGNDTGGIDKQKWALSPWQISANERPTGGLPADTTGNAGEQNIAYDQHGDGRYYVADRYYYLSTIKTKLTLTNLTSLTQEYKILLVQAKKNFDSSHDPIATWLECANSLYKGGLAPAPQSESMAQSHTTTQFGSMGGLQPPLVPTDARLYPGNDPRAYKQWNKMWKTLKCFKFMLGAGETHEIDETIKINKLFGYQSLKDQIGQYSANTTIVPVIIVKTVPVCLDTADHSTQSMSYGVVKFGVMMNSKISFKPLDTTKWSTASISYNIPMGGTVVATEKQITDTDTLQDAQMIGT